MAFPHYTTTIQDETQSVLKALGKGKVHGVAYDTAWIARLSLRYPNQGFERSLEWLRVNQAKDGSWGSSALHYHDRFISTLAAIIALKETGYPEDRPRIRRGEQILWKLVGHLGNDNSDTIGFPVLSSALAEEATMMGLDVPRPSTRYADAYRQKVDALLTHSNRNWRKNTLSFSLEGMRSSVMDEDEVLEENFSVNVSPSATAGYLLKCPNELALEYLKWVLANDDTGGAPAVAPIDIFEITWTLNHLRLADAIDPDMQDVRYVLDYLWQVWSDEKGVSYSRYFGVPNLDDTASCFSVLHWGGYPVNLDVFSRFEREHHFYCFPNETDISLGAHIRLLSALKQHSDFDRDHPWVTKIVEVFHRFNRNGSFWWDKWHTSPYYLSSTAVMAMEGISDELAFTRLHWILKTQNEDGGWGYLDYSTPEETAYALEALLYWDRTVEPIDSEVLARGANFLYPHAQDTTFTPLWIGKSLYTPHYPVKAAVLGALLTYERRG